MIIYRNKQRISKRKTNDNLWQFIMTNAYYNWGKNTSREKFLSDLTPYEKLAVIFGNFNYQVQNGGFSQWVFNNYDSDIDGSEEFIENCDFDKKDVFERMFENYRSIKSSLDSLNEYDDFYYEDVETREKHYCDNDENYYYINEEWEEYFSDYLLKNMPEEYYQYIVDYEISKPII